MKNEACAYPVRRLLPYAHPAECRVRYLHARERRRSQLENLAKDHPYRATVHNEQDVSVRGPDTVRSPALQHPMPEAGK